MHFYRIFAILSIALLGCVSQSKAPRDYDYTPVMLHASSIKQADTLGFNIVNEIHELIYPRFLTGDLTLWENSDKQMKLSEERFLSAEKKAVVPFVRNNDLFIHEVWKIFKKNYDFGILGFSFSGKNKNGNSINYGYVDAIDLINLLKSENIPCNANGASALTFWNALHSKQYYFNIVQFGNNNFKTNPIMAFEIRNQAILDKKIHRNLYEIVIDKEIEYKVLSPSINSSPENNNFYQVMEKGINGNKQTILNAGGAKYFSHLKYVNWKIDNIVVTEQWTKRNKLPFQELTSIQLFIDKHPITLSKEQIEELNIKINLQGIEEYLSEKPFNFLLQRINSQEIVPQNADNYYKALQTKNWRHITL